MARRQVDWARRARAKLIAELGGRCTVCGTTEALELDCIDPQGHRHHRLGVTWRICFYRAQARAGNLQVLCAHHNNVKASYEQLYYR